MQVIETSSDGLEKVFKITIPYQELQQQLGTRLEELRQTTRMNGFRTGKVPMTIIRRRYASDLRRKILKEQLDQAIQQATQDLRVVGTPRIRDMSAESGRRSESELHPEGTSIGDTSTEGTSAGDSHPVTSRAESDREYEMTCEVAPEIEICDLASIELERLVVEAGQDEVARVLGQLAERYRDSEPAADGWAAQRGDILEVNITGSYDGRVIEEFSEQARLLDLDHLDMPDFGEHLLGLGVGDEKTFDIPAPPDYPVRLWVGRVINFRVEVKSIRTKLPAAIDDALARRVGHDELSQLEEATRSQLEQQYQHHARTLLKQRLLDHLEQRHDFPLPNSILETEYQMLCRSEKQEESLPEAVRAEYLALAKRRVRMGLLFEKFAHQYQLEVSDEELQLAAKYWLRYQHDADTSGGTAAEGTAPRELSQQQLQHVHDMVFENKIFDFISNQITLIERSVSPAEFKQAEIQQEQIRQEFLRSISPAESLPETGEVGTPATSESATGEPAAGESDLPSDHCPDESQGGSSGESPDESSGKGKGKGKGKGPGKTARPAEA